MDTILGLAFKETQRIRQWWIWLLILIVAGSAWTAFVHQIVLSDPFGENPAPDFVIWLLFIIFGVGLPWLIFSIRMVTQVRSDRVYIRFFPLHSRTIYFEDIKSYTACKYHPIKEYGGWGIRRSLRNGMAYNISGNRGVRFELNNGKKILIGSQKPDEFAAAIQRELGW